MNVTIGQRIDEFEVISLLGSGAAGTVFMGEARESTDNIIRRGTRYALKVYNDRVLGIPKQRERISRELLGSMRAPHRNLVRVIAARVDYGSPALTYSIMELVTGRTLDVFVKENHPLQGDVIESVFGQLMDGVFALHRANLIHRDIKPQNIMIDDGHRVILMDLGVVKFQEDKAITQSDQFLGTIRYAAPEMLFGEKYNNTVDIYTAGAVLYLLLTGNEPFMGQRMFSNMVVEKREKAQLFVTNNLSDHSSLRVRILSQLVSSMTASETGWGRNRVQSADTVLDVLNHMEMSDWWISSFTKAGGMLPADRTPVFKTLLLRYLDPRMPKSSSERVERLRHLVPSELMMPFLEYLMTIENPEGMEGIRPMLVSLKEEEDYVPGESGD